MLAKDSIIVFSDDQHQTVDGLPFFSILHADLKNLLNEQEKKIAQRIKVVRNPPVDMGVQKTANDQMYGATIDPSTFKGNVDLQMHLNHGLHSKMKVKFDKSQSITKKKIKKRTAQDDFNIRLPDSEIKKHHHEVDSTDDEEDIRRQYEAESQQKSKIERLLKLMADNKEGKKIWFPGIIDGARRGSTMVNAQDKGNEDIDDVGNAKTKSKLFQVLTRRKTTFINMVMENQKTPQTQPSSAVNNCTTPMNVMMPGLKLNV